MHVKSTIGALTAALAAALACLPGPAVADEDLTDSPYLAHPALAELTSELTFYVSFDQESLAPNIAAGEKGLLTTAARPRKKKPKARAPSGEYAPGIVGKALRLGSGVGRYATDGNIALTTCGSIALWVKPLEWHENGDGMIDFVGTPGRHFGIARSGKMVRARDGKKLSNEWVGGNARIGPNKGRANLPIFGRLTNGEWHLIVYKWAWPTIGMSIDGQPFRTKSLPRIPADILGTVKSFYLGCRRSAPTLMDEVMVFKRPLDASEAKLLFDTVRSWSKQNRHAQAEGG